jgi:hypothetical protein
MILLKNRQTLKLRYLNYLLAKELMNSHEYRTEHTICCSSKIILGIQATMFYYEKTYMSLIIDYTRSRPFWFTKYRENAKENGKFTRDYGPITGLKF